MNHLSKLEFYRVMAKYYPGRVQELVGGANCTVELSMAEQGKNEAADVESQAKVLAQDLFVGNVSKLIPLPVDHKWLPMCGPTPASREMSPHVARATKALTSSCY